MVFEGLIEEHVAQCDSRSALCRCFQSQFLSLEELEQNTGNLSLRNTKQESQRFPVEGKTLNFKKISAFVEDKILNIQQHET